MTTKNVLTSAKGQSSLQRPRYSPGLLLEDEDLTAGIDYTRDLVRLALRSLFGCGVVCGLEVTPKLSCGGTQLDVNVGPGLAFDCMGNPIEVTAGKSLSYSHCDMPGNLYVVACYVETCCSPRDVSCSADDDGQVVQTRVRGGYEITLQDTLPGCACACGKPPAKPANGSADCCNSGSDAAVAPTPTPTPAPAPVKADLDACYKDHKDGVCACACGCSCVLLASFVIADGIATPDETVVPRRIRPVLTGFTART